MAHPAVPAVEPESDPPHPLAHAMRVRDETLEPAPVEPEDMSALAVVEAELVPLDKPVVVGPTYAELVDAGCTCGNVTAVGHNGMSCEEIIAIRLRVAYGRRPWWRRVTTSRPEGWPR